MGKTSTTIAIDAVTQTGAPLVPGNEEQQVVVRTQLERILSSPLFANSQRYPRLLKFIVEETLAGRGRLLKERTLGVTVFNREPAYDTNADPVVRTSAAQVRRRLGQYYDQPANRFELRIELSPGSYVPEFHLPIEPVELKQVGELALPALGSQTKAKDRKGLLGFRLLPSWPIGIAVIAALMLVAVSAARMQGPNDVAKFWQPVWDEQKPLVFCMPGRFPTDADAPLAAPGNAPRQLSILESLRLNSVPWPDATTLYTMVGFVKAHKQSYAVRRAGDSSLADLRTGPTVFIGGFNNAWLLRLQGRYRFTYEREWGANRGWIRDAENPAKHDWGVNWASPYNSFDEDYGIISRVTDPVTEHIVILASGIAAYGTIAAGEFLTNPKHLALISKKAPNGWQKKNIQVVFSTKVFNGNAGPPKILAVHVW